MSVAIAEDLDAVDRQATPSVTKALQLLDAFRHAGPTLGVSEIARLAGVPKSTAFRLLAYLEQSGFVEREGRDYVLGRHLFELGNSVPLCRPRGLRDVAAPHLSQLFVKTNKVVHLAVLEGTDIVYVEKIYGHDTVQVPTAVGRPLPAASSYQGTANHAFSDRGTKRHGLEDGLATHTRYSIAEPARFLQELRRVHRDAVAFDREEVQLGLVCTASPILVDGRAVAAVSVAGQATRFNPAAVANDVRRAAEAISRDYLH